MINVLCKIVIIPYMQHMPSGINSIAAALLYLVPHVAVFGGFWLYFKYEDWKSKNR